MRETFGYNKDRIKFDFYQTEESCVLDIIRLENLHNLKILENSAGNGNIARPLIKAGNSVFCIDIVQRDYPLDLVADFASLPLFFPEFDEFFDCIVMNPPFSLLNEFIETGWRYTNRQIIFCRLQFLETMKRYDNIFKKKHLKCVYIYSSRQITNNNMEANSMCFIWAVLDKNNTEEPVIRWITPKG